MISEARLNRKKNGLCVYCEKPAGGKTRCSACNKRDADASKLRYQEFRRIVIQHYGSKCVCCDESTDIFLAIDHIDQHQRHRTKRRSATYYKWFIDNNFPVGFRILCHCCNYGIYRSSGKCPGEQSKHRLNNV